MKLSSSLERIIQIIYIMYRYKLAWHTLDFLLFSANLTKGVNLIKLSINGKF